MTKQKPKVILVTGSSSGFGLLIAARLSSKGNIVIASMRNLDKQNAVLSEANKRGSEVKIAQLDVTNIESIKDTMEKIKLEYGYIDVLINNAGYGIGGFFEDLTADEFRDQMETNFLECLM